MNPICYTEHFSNEARLLYVISPLSNLSLWNIIYLFALIYLFAPPYLHFLIYLFVLIYLLTPVFCWSNLSLWINLSLDTGFYLSLGAKLIYLFVEYYRPFQWGQLSRRIYRLLGYIDSFHSIVITYYAPNGRYSAVPAVPAPCYLKDNILNYI